MNTYRCENCDKVFKAYSQAHSAGRRFCSKACFREWWHKKNKQLEKARIRICKNCGRSFLKKTNNAGIFCSHTCWVKWKKAHRKIRISICEHCGKEFEWKKFVYQPEGKKGRIKRRFCSIACFKSFRKSHQKPKKVATCPVCGTEFELGQYHKKFCSTACYNVSRDTPEITRWKGCKTILRKHHENLKHDPERLSTKFIAKMIGCACPKAKGGA